MTWEQLYEALNRFPVSYPPLSNEGEAWLWQTPDLNLNQSSDFHAFHDWLTRTLAGTGNAARFPAPLPALNASLWRDQADRAEDSRETCPDGAWLTDYVAYLHRCADIIEALQIKRVTHAN